MKFFSAIDEEAFKQGHRQPWFPGQLSECSMVLLINRLSTSSALPASPFFSTGSAGD
jgi:hypothetical protein